VILFGEPTIFRTIRIHMEVTMPPLFAGFLGEFNLQTLIAVGSACVTGYFWLVKMNRERAGLKLYRIGDFKPDRLQCGDVAGKEKATWYGDICIANPSSLPVAVVGFRVQLMWRRKWIDGKLVMERKDDVPWTVEPLRVLARSFGCAFPVEQGTTREQLLQPHKLRFSWTTVDGRTQSQDIVTSVAAAMPALRAAA
jgi:hypothetical protein